MKNGSRSNRETAIHHGKLTALSLGLPGTGRIFSKKPHVSPGEMAGIDHLASVNVPPVPGNVKINCIDYSPSDIDTGTIEDLDAFLATPLPEWIMVRWINVSTTNPYVINQFRQHFGFHTLSAEDVLHIPQRPRIESFDDHLFVVLRMIQLVQPNPDGEANGLVLETEQVSLFLYDRVLITFQEKQGDVWQPIRDRLQMENQRIRRNGTGYLLYTLMDAIVDHCFPVLEQYGDSLEEIEISTLESPTPEILHRIHSLKRELALLRRIIWPTREVVDQLIRAESDRLDESTRPYLRDVYEHTIQIVEIVETYREMAGSMTDLYMSAASNKTNEIMKVLTIMASVFIPLTFLSSVYGMNFRYMPELALPWAYPALWLIFSLLTIAMLFYFRRRGWIGKV